MVDISVIIPCYNCEKWIKNCMVALKRQIFKNFEVICVDDCSTDNTNKILQKYKSEVDFPIVIFQNKSNIGPAASRNKAMKYARSKYLCFCDSDDWYEDTYLEEMYRKIIDGNYDLVMCEYKKIFESKKEPVEVHYLKGYSEKKYDLIAFSKAAMPLLIFKKEIVGNLEIPDLRNGEDIAFIPCIESKAKSIGVIEKPLYNYRMREGSASKKPNQEIYISLQKAFDFIQMHNVGITETVLEYIGIKTLLYGATINALKANMNFKDVKNIKNEFEYKYPNWSKNKYMFLFSRQKRIYLFFMQKERMCFCKLLANIHKRISC